MWVDDLKSFARIAPEVNPRAESQTLGGITLFKWDTTLCELPETVAPADIVVEAFACTPPAVYVERMSVRQLWLNLEYLSAEAWVESCHRLPSVQPNGLRKFFFFPGFTEATGGLLREPELLARRDAWQADAQARLDLLADLGVSEDWLHRLRGGARLVYVFCYPQAPLPALLQALSSQQGDTLILMAAGLMPPEAWENFSGAGNVGVHEHPFVNQARFDQLLWGSDLIIVRGEDSFVRAIWAGRPMIWQPYLQDEDLHLEKLSAWLALSPYSADIKRAMLAWNQQDGPQFKDALTALLYPADFARWQTEAQAMSLQLAQQQDLATQLLTFCAEQSQTS